jgi:hypothetical protein
MNPLAGRTSPNARPCTSPTAGPSAASTRNTRVRTTSDSDAPASASAAAMISRQREAWAAASGSTEPSGRIAAVAET